MGRQALLGPEAAGFSPATISRLKQRWHEELAQWKVTVWRGNATSVYFLVDGVYFATRLEEARHGILIILGAPPSGHTELIGLWDGYRESAQSWKDLPLDLKSRGLEHGPTLAIGDGAMGFCKALRQVYGKTRRQRCWVHKTANVLDKLPKDLQPQAKQRLQAIWMASDRQRATMAFDLCMAAYEAKYPKAAECLAQDREVL